MTHDSLQSQELLSLLKLACWPAWWPHACWWNPATATPTAATTATADADGLFVMMYCDVLVCSSCSDTEFYYQEHGERGMPLLQEELARIGHGQSDVAYTAHPPVAGKKSSYPDHTSMCSALWHLAVTESQQTASQPLLASVHTVVVWSSCTSFVKRTGSRE